MALTSCRECGHQVSEKAEGCPSCGAPLKEFTAKGCLLFLIFLILVIWSIGMFISYISVYSVMS